MALYKQTAELIKSLVGNEYLYLDNSIMITGNVFAYPLHIWAVCVSPYNDIYVMHGEQLWHQVEFDDREMIEAVHRRIAAIAPRYIGAVVPASEFTNVSIAQPA